MKRQRTLGAIYPNMIVAEYFRWDSTPLVYSNINAWSLGATRVTTDYVTPSWMKLRDDGVIINNPFSTLYKQYGYTNGSRLVVYNRSPPPYTNGAIWKTKRTGNNGVGSDLTGLSIDRESLVRQACTDALSKVGAPSVLGLTVLAEMHQTLATLRNPLQSILELLKRLKSGKKTSSLDVSQALANQHLAVLYGILPFMHDVSGIVKALTAPSSTRFTARAMASETKSSNTTRVYNDGEVTGLIKRFDNLTMSVRAYALYSMDASLLNDRLGLSFGAIPATLLELTPWSFVADWFVNLQSLIGALTPCMGIKYLAEGYTVRTVTGITEQLGDISAVNSDYAAKGGGDIATYSSIAKERVVTPLSAYVGLAWRPRLSVGTVSAAISLIIQSLPNRHLNLSRGDQWRHIPRSSQYLRFS